MPKINRPRISIYIAASIDGYIARKDESLDWMDRVGGYDEDYGFKKLLNSIDALIIGRKTYAVASTVPDPYPGKRVIVLSNSLDAVTHGMELYRGDLRELGAKLHREGVEHIWVDGGVTISQFLASQMVDTMTLSIIPVILGDGIPLFNVIGKEIPCRLVSSQSYPSGLVQINYEIIKGGGRVGGVQGPGDIPQQAKDDVNEMADDYAKLGDLYMQYLQTTDPAKKDALEKQMTTLLGKIASLGNDLRSITPPLSKEILGKIDDVMGQVKTIMEYMERPQGSDYFQLGIEIGGLQQLING